MIEYRLCVDRDISDRVDHYPKRDLTHARQGVKDAYRDFGRLSGPNAEAWIESRTVTEWEEVEDGS